MPETMRCVVCGGEFYTEFLKDGKCVVCNERYPAAHSHKEILGPARKEPLSPSMEASVRSVVRDEVERLMAPKKTKTETKNG